MDKKKASSISSSETFAKRRAIFLSVQNALKLLSTDLVNTKPFSQSISFSQYRSCDDTQESGRFHARTRSFKDAAY